MSVASGRIWDETSTPSVQEQVDRFETDWKKSHPGRRPDPVRYVGDGSKATSLAVFRADMVLRWAEGDRVCAEFYRDRVRTLAPDALVALIYEEFCLREERGESPNSADFLARFPEVAAPLRRVLDIHELVGSGPSTTASFLRGAMQASDASFPEAGQTIAGFHLVEELGRGGFARVFRAEERQLADRPVALKVARAGSREPQMLARLQHTHIVPVYSYRIDKATGLHLLCMPFFGRVTLAHVFSDKAVKTARSGAELVEALNGLNRDKSVVSTSPAGLKALAERTYSQAIAWWGARLAEALQHAHERGVMHRDIKPSNVLVTSDGMPMLLDFNLAQEPLGDDPETIPAALGGTVAYMSPEHLDALAEGEPEGVDARTDIYSLGVVLFEAMGERPFGPPTSGNNIPEALHRLARDRRLHPPRLRDVFPEAPPAMHAVVSRCLAPDPENRYASAAELAADLQAVADDAPLKYAREPILHRASGWARRHRKALVVSTPLLLAIGLTGFLEFNTRMVGERKYGEALLSLQATKRALADATNADQFALVKDRAKTTEKLAEESPHSATLLANTRALYTMAAASEQTFRMSERFFAQAEELRARLLGHDLARPSHPPTIVAVLAPFHVLDNPDWTVLTDPEVLGAEGRSRLVREVTELMFLQAAPWAVSEATSELEASVALCDKALVFVPKSGQRPWKALRAIATARMRGKSTPAIEKPSSESKIDSAWECYQWGRILLLVDPKSSDALVWLDRAARQSDMQFWLKLDVAIHEDRADRYEAAIEHYNAAIDLQPRHPLARFGRGRLLAKKGEWSRAKDDLQIAIADHPGFSEAEMELGFVSQSIGEFVAARRSYEHVLSITQDARYRRAARLNRAKLDFVEGHPREARVAYDQLIAEMPSDTAALLGRALLSMHQNDAPRAESDATAILKLASGHADALALRAWARLMMNRPSEAMNDAEIAMKLDASPPHERLLQRAWLAAGRFDAIRFDDPAAIRLLPAGGINLVDDLRLATDRLRVGPAAQATRAVILAALGNPAAEVEAARVVAANPQSTHARLALAHIRLDRGNLAGALEPVERGLKTEPNDPRLLTLRGTILVASGRPAAALADLDQAIRLGGSVALRRPHAEALMQLGRYQEALNDWNRLVEFDPEDPSAYLGRARAFLGMGRASRTLADLERSANEAGDQANLLARIAFHYARLLPQRPDHAGRVISLARRAIASWANRQTPGRSFARMAGG